MRKGRLGGLLRVTLASVAIAVGTVSIIDARADASSADPYPHSCYAGCCDTCQGGLCCFDEPPLPDPDRVPLPIIPER